MKFFETQLHPFLMRALVILGGLGTLFILGVYGYGGFFTRYVGDDYCRAFYFMTTNGLWDATIKAYNTWLNSYSILLFIYLSDLPGMLGTQLFPAFILFVWLLSLVWLLMELEWALALEGGLGVALWLGGLAIFISLFQTPVLFQILYWRTGSIPYSFPLAFFLSGAAFLLWYIRQPYDRARAQRSGVGLFVWVAFASGLCETTSALQVGLLLVGVLVAWWTLKEHGRRDVLVILACALVSAVGSLLVIAFSPGTLTRLNVINLETGPIFNPITLGLDVLLYTYQFVTDALMVAPLPNLVAFLTPLALLYSRSARHAAPGVPGLPGLKRAAWVIPVFTFIVIGFSFAPSAFVETYPVARARFAGQFVMTLGLLFEGGVLGLLLTRVHLPVNPRITQALALAFLALAVWYPLRAFERVYAPIPTYQAWAAAWDERDASIRAAMAAGATDLSVVQLESIGDVIEYKGDPLHWVNVCAAQYYGLNSIVAP